MAVIRTHQYTVDPDALTEFLSRRAAAIAAVRSRCPGLAHTRVVRHEDGSYTDTWQWESAAQMNDALAAMPLPEVGAAMSLVRDHDARDGEVLDER